MICPITPKEGWIRMTDKGDAQSYLIPKEHFQKSMRNEQLVQTADAKNFY